MTYRLLYHPDVHEVDLGPIPTNIRRRIRKAIETRLVRDPVLVGQPLKQSLKGHRKMRVGDWRVIYRIEADAIIILMIGNRKDVYKDIVRRI